MPVALRLKVWVCGHPLAENAGSNRVETTDVCLL
jgi:hypothetical protein